MKIKRIWATTKRVLLQLKHDPRTLILLFLSPVLLLTILKFVYWSTPPQFQKIGGSMLGVFPMLMMFLITSITTLRERSSGTLERLMISPLRKFELILGYTKAFLLVSLIQSTFISTYTIWILRLKIAGSALSLILVSLLSSAIGLAIGLSISSFANNEFQAIQFMPAILLPQLLLSGALIPRSSMPRVLDDLSNFLPLSYSMDALKKVLIGQGSIVGDSFIILGIVALILTLGSLLLTGQSR